MKVEIPMAYEVVCGETWQLSVLAMCWLWVLVTRPILFLCWFHVFFVMFSCDRRTVHVFIWAHGERGNLTVLSPTHRPQVFIYIYGFIPHSPSPAFHTMRPGYTYVPNINSESPFLSWDCRSIPFAESSGRSNARMRRFSPCFFHCPLGMVSRYAA